MKKQNPKQSTSRKKRIGQRNFNLEPLEPRCLLAGLQGISVDDGSLLESIETTAPREMTLIFDADEVISDSETSLAGITLVHGGEDRTLGTDDDVRVEPGFLGIGDRPNEVVIRFAENLPDNIYRLEISGNGSNAVRNVFGEAFDQDPDQPGIQDFQQVFRLDLGAQVVSVVPQPIERNDDGSLTQRRNQIVVHFNNDPLSQGSAERTDFYQLRYTGHSNEFDSDVDTAHDMDDIVHLPESVTYDAETNQAVLTFANNLDELDNGDAEGNGTYRLQIGLNSSTPLRNSPEHVDATTDAADQFDTALDLGEVLARGIIIDAAIDTRIAPLPYPGANAEIGHRDIGAQNHFINEGFASDLNPGATTILYNFQDIYGQDPEGNDLQNLITENQKDLARQILDIYSYYAGLQFVETDDIGFTIVTGDLRAADPGIPTGPGGVLGVATGGNFIDGLAIMDATELWTDEFSAERGGNSISWFSTAMHEIGHILGLGHTHDLPANTIQGQDETGGPLGLGTQTVADPEPAFPGNHDIAHLQHIHRPESNDVDLYMFNVTDPGLTTIETFAERLDNASLVDTHITVWQEVGGERVRIASNDDYYSEDSYLELTLEEGTYFVGVSSTGNDEYNPNVAESGEGGTSEGRYELRIHHRAELASGQQIQDRNESLHSDPSFTPSVTQPLDGDYDGVAGGAFNFWFRTAAPENTLIVDKAGSGDFTQIDQAMAAAQPGDIVRVVGNGGDDGDLSTIADNDPYLIGRDILGNTLPDGNGINVGRGVTLMVDAGAILKFRSSSIIAGSTAPGIDNSGSAVQILGTPDNNVYLGSYRDDSLGGDSDGFPESATAGDWGGVLFVGDIDQANDRFNYEDQSIFLNHINNASITHAGGQISLDSVTRTAAPIEMRDVRVTATFNHISNSAESAIAATPDSFEETNFHAPEFQSTEFTADYTRVGPVIHGNQLTDNTFNALFIRTETVAGDELLPMTVSGRWDDTDITHVITENLTIRGQASVLLDSDNILPTPQEGNLIARPDARLRIDAGTVVKIDGAVIELGIGAQLIAEGTDSKQVVFTSLFDDTFGGSGTFDTTSDGTEASSAAPGDWGGIYLGFTSHASLDRARLAYGGGTVPVEGSFAGFNVIEVHQADLRLTNSIIENNAGGTGGQAPETRFGRTSNGPAAVFIRNSQPILANNIIQNTTSLTGELASAISINVNALTHDRVVDTGRSTGTADTFTNHLDNQGPLIFGNQIGGNDLNGLEVRSGTLTTESVWDDADIVHLVFGEIASPNFHTFGGLRLESSPQQSLVVKLSSTVRGDFTAPFFDFDPFTGQFVLGCNTGSRLVDTNGDRIDDACISGTLAGITAAGRTLDIDDRIGGTVQIVGHPNFPVVLTSVGDNTVGAGQTPDGEPQLSVFGDDSERTASSGDWRGIQFQQYANDRNVDTVIEFEPTDIDFEDTGIARNNATTAAAQFIGVLAEDQKSGDETLRLGFDVHGVLARPGDVDTFSFEAYGGTEVWFDIDNTTNSLDAVIELVNADGEVIARSESSHLEALPESFDSVVNARNLSKTGFYQDDHFSINQNDPGMRLVLPGSGLTTRHIRIRSNGDTAGAYELQVRLSELDEVAGSTVRFADIRYATNGIDLVGLPGHSPLLGEAAEIGTPLETLVDINSTIGLAQPLGNVLDSDRGAVSVAGILSSFDDVDWYNFEVTTPLLQTGASYASITIDLDYSDGSGRSNASFALYDENNQLIAFADDSNIADDLSAPQEGSDVDDLTRGSFGFGDGFLGPLSLPEGNYSLAVFTDASIPRELATTLERDLLEEFPEEVPKFLPLDSVEKIAVDRIDRVLDPLTGEPINVIDTDFTLRPVALTLNDLKLFVTTDGPNNTSDLNTVNPFTGVPEVQVGRFGAVVGDLATRPDDGALVSLTQGFGPNQNDETAGNGIVINPEDGSITGVTGDPDGEILDDGIVTFEDDGEMMGIGAEVDVGVNFEALAFGNNRFWGVGNLGQLGLAGPDYEENILYEFDAFTLAALPDNPLRDGDATLFEGAFTDRVDKGFIDTVNSAAGNERLTVTGDATQPSGSGPVFFVDDGDSFDAAGMTFEINTGAQIVLSELEVRDGDILRLNISGQPYDFQFETGPTLELRTVTGLVAGGTFTIGTTNFEYVTGGLPTTGNVPIDISGIATTTALAERIEAIVEANTGGGILVDFYEVMDNGQPTVRVSFTNDTGLAGTTIASTGFLGGAFEGEYGGDDLNGDSICAASSTCVLVGVEEIDSIAELQTAIETAYRTAPGLTAGRVGAAVGRMNFLDGNNANFVERGANGALEFIDVRPGNSLVSGIAVDIFADDTDVEIAGKIAAAVTGSSIDPASPNTIVLTSGFSNQTDPPFLVSGLGAPGGVVTGITFLGGSLYAVSDAGGFFRVDNPAASAAPNALPTTFISNIGAPLVGLSLGPQDFDGGSLAETFFAIDSFGDLHAFDINGIAVDVFDSGMPVAEGEAPMLTSTVSTGLVSPNGLEFSTYQENAWNIQGGAREIDGEDLEAYIERSGFVIDADEIDLARQEDAGHGVVTPITEIGDQFATFGARGGPLELDFQEQPGGASYYFGRATAVELDIDEDGDVQGFETVNAYDYDFPGGARGSLLSDPFSLVDIDSQDEPYLYFNYLLDTENANGPIMQDSLRVYVIDDDGLAHLVATNNDDREIELQCDTPITPLTPGCSGLTSNAGFNGNGADLYGRVQELFDNELVDEEGNRLRAERWHQARIPLADFAHQENLQLRFDFSTEGGFNDPTLPADTFGVYSALLGADSSGVQDNRHEGAWIDDITIGLAERGELIVSGDDIDDTNTRPSNEARIVPNLAIPDFQIEEGAYQIEIRRSLDYDLPAVIESNDRSDRGILIRPGEAVDLAPSGRTFEISNGLEEFVFEFVEDGQDPTAADSITVGFQPNATRLQIATALVNTINSVAGQSDITAELTRGVTGFINLHGDTVLLIDGSGLAESESFDLVGDDNRLRDQGQIVISSNFIRDSAEYGIRLEATRNDAGLGNPGAPINFIETDQPGLAPGAAIVNNLVIRGGIGGILINGNADAEDLNSASRAATPFARVINNTIVGAVSGTFGSGITVTNNASPTLLNNILDSLVTGINIDFSSSSTVVGGSLFRNVDFVGTTGDFALELASFESLFVDPLTDNFFPADGSRAVDSSVDSLNDRDELVTVRDPLGIGRSPIIVPSRDASGQLRVDDPNVVNSSGQGAGVFFDRGALDRSDFIGPNAAIIGPRDNDPDGVDLNSDDHDLSVLENPEAPIREFLVQLVDGGGADTSLGGFGVDDATVLTEAVELFRDEELLEEGVDYSFEFDSTNNQIHLVPATGIWATGIYRIEIDDTVQDLFGNPLLANRPGGSTIFNINVGGGAFDFGDAPSPYRTSLDADGARHSQLDGSDLFLGTVPSSEADSRTTDEDDGITFTTEFIQGNEVVIVANASQSGFLDGWIDFNGDGDWNDAGEQVVTSLQLVEGDNTITFGVPANATPGTAFSRFRLSPTGGLSPLGETNGGEVEDYPVQLETPGDDFGDAPSIYPTLLGNNGAVHTIVPGFFLGNAATGEEDAFASADADGDAADDGVTFDSGLILGRSSQITISASQPGVLSAWIDWNGDRTWAPNEQIFTNQNLQAGENVFTIDTPANAVAGTTVSRFRFASLGGLQPTGRAADGEVEDYQVFVEELSWHNSGNPLDVNNDGTVAPVDAIQVINELNNRQLSAPNGILNLPADPEPFLDVNDDGFVSPIDALQIINALNNQTSATVASAERSALSAAVTDGDMANSANESSSDALRDLAFAGYDDDADEEEESDTETDKWWLV